jgi:hypothetical protein
LHRYVSDFRMWFQSWLLEPVRKAMGGLIEPTQLSALRRDIVDVEQILATNLGEPVVMDDQRIPMLNRVLL